MAGVALSPTFEVALAFRFLCGIAEGADIVVLPMLMNKIAPKGQESLWLGIFFISNTVGVASGNSLGGLWEDYFPLEPYGLVPWQTAYLVNSALLIPAIFIALFGYGSTDLAYLDSPDDVSHQNGYSSLTNDVTADPAQKPQPLLGGIKSKSFRRRPGKGPKVDLMTSIKLLMTNGLYVLILLGPLVSLICTGAYNVYLIAFIEQKFELTKFQAGSSIAAVSMFAGGTGTVLGGMLTDWLRHFNQASHNLKKSISTALLVPVLVVAIGSPAFTLAFWVDQFYLFIICNAVSTLCMTMCPAPTMYVALITML